MIWFVCGNVRTFVSNQSRKNNHQTLKAMYAVYINRKLKANRIAKRIVESALVLALAKLAIEIVLTINS